MNDTPTIQSVVDSLAEDLKSYLEAQYHVRDEAALHERRALLDDDATIAQIPFLESTPSYDLTVPYGEIDLPPTTKALLSAISRMKAGLYPRPYLHQAQALQAFIQGKNILAATGTGSGKTEIFLLSILSALAEESNLGKQVTGRFGCRALILYPMNALVSDQLARLRLLFGNPDVSQALKELRSRVARFAMYTSRTPFPGPRSKRNNDRAKQLLDARYAPILADPIYLEKLIERGKWPAKDVKKFFGEKGADWNKKRLLTSPDDVELLMRHEIQKECPDILVTNYSMLEYMLVRPIERPIFEQTRNWLASYPSTFFTIVLDEAHMYRGATGAEVSFLLRRLIQRLDISRERVRFILTTASVGSATKDQEAALAFACDLTSLPRSDSGKFAYVMGARGKFSAPRAATATEADALAAFDGGAFQSISDLAVLRSMVETTMAELKVPFGSADRLSDDLFAALSGFGPAGLLVNTISGNATPLTEVARLVFPGCTDETRGKALDSLVRLSNFAKEHATGKVFLPARVHMFFRGLSGLFTCSNPECTEKRVATDSPLLGRMFSEPRVTCGCGGRVYEVLTHRDCGALYLRCYVDEKHPRPDFGWHEPTTHVRADISSDPQRLTGMHFLVSRTEPDFDGWQPCWLQISSGQIQWIAPNGPGWLTLYAPDDSHKKNSAFGGKLFGVCPLCSKTTQSSAAKPSKIMDLQTKGEQPFGQLIKRQLFSQPPDLKKAIADYPNQGRKTLLFSDGRQKAARLAKSLPEEVEADTFREMLALAYSLSADAQDTIPLTKAYLLFVAACARAHVAPYSGDDHESLLKDIDSFKHSYFQDIDDWCKNGPARGPSGFMQNLYRQVSGGLYSLRFICAGSIWPSRRNTKRLLVKFPQITEPDAIALATIWIQDFARDVAIDRDLTKIERESIQGFRAGAQSWARNGRFPSQMRGTITRLGFDIAALEEEFLAIYAVIDTDSQGYYLRPDAISLLIDLQRNWYRCRKCKSDALLTLQGRCISCGCSEIDEVDPTTDPYVRTRKGFWRQPLVDVLAGTHLPRLLSAEEHTAQLTHNDSSSGTTIIENYELRFQDILRKNEKPIDVLSCTTTMEAGINIGSLEAVGLRNVPPQRENYQQRAGRAGRRGSAISTVVTYCQGNPHDNYYYQNVHLIASGSPRELIVKSDNPKIARRHVHAFLLQEFFGTEVGVHTSADILSSLGSLSDFYTSQGDISKEAFISWVEEGLNEGLAASIAKWVWSLRDVDDVQKWAKDTCVNFCAQIEELTSKANAVIAREESTPDDQKSDLLKFLLDEALLPSYAFPTNLSAFQVEEVVADNNGQKIGIIYRPSQSAPRALTEYAPGRVITIDKKEYLSSAVVANGSTKDVYRARPLFDNPHRRPYVFCSESSCCYVEDVGSGDGSFRKDIPCPLCAVGKLRVMEMISPEIYLPEGSAPIAKLDEEPDITRATPAQFPVPLHQSNIDLEEVGSLSGSMSIYRREQAELVVVNKGDPDEQLGFVVCRECGLSSVVGSGKIFFPHETPFYVQERPAASPARRRCRGTSENVFLGHRFSTDLSIIRANITAPLCQVPHGQNADFLALQSALQTIAESLTLAAAKHFDVDYSEFSAGYRLIKQGDEDAPLVAELYMFDTLSGGAGYSQQLADAFNVVLRKHAFEILKCSDADGTGCDRSCHKCLRHYHNQYYHAGLDRRLATDLLKYLLDGTVIENPPPLEQKALLNGLADMLTFDGIAVELDGLIDGVTVPLVARGQHRDVGIYVTHGLVTPNHLTGLVLDLDGSTTAICPLNEFFLTRNLPSCFLKVKQCLGE